MHVHLWLALRDLGINLRINLKPTLRNPEVPLPSWGQQLKNELWWLHWVVRTEYAKSNYWWSKVPAWLLNASLGASNIYPVLIYPQGTLCCVLVLQLYFGWGLFHLAVSRFTPATWSSEISISFSLLTLFSSSMAISSSLIFFSSSLFSLIHSSRASSLGYWKIYTGKC